MRSAVRSLGPRGSRSSWDESVRQFIADADEDGNVIGDAELFFPLLGYPEMDFTFFHPNTLPLVKRILGGDDVPRLEQDRRG